MIFLEILVAILVGFLVYKLILLPSFSNKKIALSQIPDSFHDIFTKFNNLDFSEILSIKKKLLFYTVLGILCFVLLLFTFIFTYLNSFNMAFSIIPALALLIVIVMFLLEFKKFRVKYSNVIERFIQLINIDLSYNNISYENEENYYQSAYFDNLELKSLITKDTISGYTKENHKFYASNIVATSTTENVFNGIFATVILDKAVPSYTKINTENLEYNTSYALGATNSLLKYIEMDNSDFNKVLHVYSNNRLNTHEILTSDILDYLTEFYKKYNVNFQIVFSGNYVYFRFFISQLFTPSFMGNLFNENNFALCYIIITFILDIITKISSNMANYEE